MVMTQRGIKKIGVAAAWVIGSVVTIFVVAVIAIYVWPLTNSAVRQAERSPLDYRAAVDRHTQKLAAEEAEGVKDNCHSELLTHGQKTAKVVVMLHGYSSCPGQFSDIARFFYERGYTVYVPRAPQHGLASPTTETFTDTDLAQYANDAVNVAQGLGEEVGIVGLSGGGVLGTWAAQYRDDAVQRLLVISPFYETSAERLPKWLTKPFIVLYGAGLLPNVITDNNLHYRSLAQYLRVVANYKAYPQSAAIQSVASVVSYGDREIDHALARSIPEEFAYTNNVPFLWYQPPAEWNLGHDIVGARNNNDIGTHAAELYAIYFDVYEGRPR